MMVLQHKQGFGKMIKLWINMEEIIRLCKYVMECMVNDDYDILEKDGMLVRVSEKDIKRVLHEYNPNGDIIIPPDDCYDKIYINQYNDGSGYHVDIDLWYCSGRSDLTLQLDIRRNGNNELTAIIDDLRVL